jgi:hypothetical protein
MPFSKDMRASFCQSAYFPQLRRCIFLIMKKKEKNHYNKKKIISHYDCARTFDAVFGFHLLAVSTRFTSVTVPAKFYKYFLFLLKTHLLTALFRFH